MELNKNTREFLKKLAQKYDSTEQRALAVLNEEVHGNPYAKIEQGQIVSLNTRGISWAVHELGQKEDNVDIPVKILSLGEIDISDLYDLVHLSFRSNEKLEPQIEQYSFKNYPKLKQLDFGRHNVRSIDLKSNKDLVDLDCSSNELTELDISENVNLEKLNCQFNKISRLDLSNNSKLKYVLIRYLPINQNNILFPETNNIEELYIDETEISKINLSEFQNLCRLKIGETISSIDVTPCKNLISLSLIRTKLKSLDISDCRNLWELSVWEGAIEELTCNELQSFIVSGISKKLKQRPSLSQKMVIKTFELHSKALSHNWDEGLSKLKKILKDENCDKATATAIFWMGRPNYYLQFKKVSEVPEHAKEVFRFLNKLEKQLIDNCYSVNLISFNPKNHLNNDWTTDSLNPSSTQREIADKLKKEVIGTETKEFNLSKKLTLKYS